MRKEGVSGRVLVAAGLMILIIGIFGCGRMPPAGFWKPDAADSAAIRDVVLANKGLLEMRFTEDSFQSFEWVISESIIKKAIKDNPFKMRFKCDSLQHIFSTEEVKFKFNFIAVADTATKETTATVTVVETIPGVLRLHAYKYTRFVKDSIIVTPSETLRLPYYDTVFTDTSMVVEKPINGVVLGGCVLRKESGQWRLWKLAGGQRFYAPNPDDAPPHTTSQCPQAPPPASKGYSQYIGQLFPSVKANFTFPNLYCQQLSCPNCHWQIPLPRSRPA